MNCRLLTVLRDLVLGVETTGDLARCEIVGRVHLELDIVLLASTSRRVDLEETDV